MASVKIKVVLDSDAPEKIYRLPQVKAAVTKQANEIAERANSMSAGFHTGLYYQNGHHVAGVGNKQPNYVAKPTKETSKGAIALVVTGNYAAMKDTLEHNTLLKARG